MIWHLSHRADAECVPMADRHYSRGKIGSPQFAPPGRCIVLKARVGSELKAVWITSWPFAQYVRHAWPGAWINSLFRNEGAGLSSDLIRQAIAATRWQSVREPAWEGGVIPALGMVTFIDASKTRHKRDPGRCYRKAGFKPARCPKHETVTDGCPSCQSRTAGGLVAVQLFADDMPEAERPLGVPDEQPSLFAYADPKSFHVVKLLATGGTPNGH